MDRLSQSALQQPTPPRTAAAVFSVTAADVGSPAVRAGHMADLEQEHDILLKAAKLAVKRLQQSRNGDAIAEVALVSAIAIAEAGR